MGTWIINGLIAQGTEVPHISGEKPVNEHLYIENGKLAGIMLASEGLPELSGHNVIDAAGKLVAPGLIDMHVHLREPGFEHKETIATGTRSAAKGGFTTIACMPNTKPVIDTAETVRLIYDKAEQEGSGVRVLPYGSITVRELCRELTEFEDLKKRGSLASPMMVWVSKARR